MGKFFLFIWHWVLPFIGIAAIVGSVYVYFSIYAPHMRAIEEFVEIEPERKQPDVRIASPDNSREIVFVRFQKRESINNALFPVDVVPYADGFIYLVEESHQVAWIDDFPNGYFTENFKDDRNDDRFLTGRWASNDRVIVEYCGVEVSDIESRAFVGKVSVEIELHRAPNCPADLKIGEEELEDR